MITIKTNIYLAQIIFWYGLLLLSCTPQLAGNASETTNGVVACIVTDDNSPVANAIVRLRRTDYFAPLPPRLYKQPNVTSVDTITDGKGRFEINGVEPGNYLIEVTENQSSAVLLSCTILDNDTNDLGTQKLKPFASIAGIVDSMTTRAYILVRGLERLVTVDSTTGTFAITDLPAATFDLLVITIDEQRTEINKVKAESGDTTSVAVFPHWHFAKRLTLNTTSTGANVTEDNYDFPLLIRLDSSHFNFSQARNSGEDVRFIKTDGTILSHEIEHWVAAEKQATIWVKLDTVYGNSDRQAIMILWGNATAAQASEGAAVFDTALGFRAVFHLDNTSNLSDASANLSNGTNYGALNAEGVTGGALEFINGQPTYVMFPHKDNLDAASLLENPTGCTFSWWMFPYEDLDTISGTTRRNIISKGVNWNDDVDQDWAVFISEDTLLFEGHSLESSEIDKFATAGTPNASWDAQKWYHITFAYDRQTVQWFINGEPDGPGVAFDYTFDNSVDKADISIGRHYNSMPVEEVFNGVLDEIRIENIRRSAGWVKLSYMNQKADNPLVKIE
ncbi:MAG: DUF2341 domain-containing protein [Chitinispirillaceae bacterium]|nr:DUF2341 domain-containing protein [Chitinispirillaceae bacterium]